MDKLNKNIEQHYLKEGLLEDILDRLKEQDADLDSISRTDISGVDEFHVRGATVSRELAQSINLDGHSALDVGCGLGGPSRMLADEFNCNVTGIDLSKEYIRTANGLSELVSLENKTHFIVGDATNLPFENNSFEVVWTQHVQMNIPDKQRFYSEIYRVLKPGGHFLYYDIFKNSNGTIEYPMPWASSPDQSFLFKSGEMTIILEKLGLKRVSKTDQTHAGILFFDALLAHLKKDGPPRIGLNVLMGESTKPKLLNLWSHMKKQLLMLESGVYKKG